MLVGTFENKCVTHSVFRSHKREQVQKAGKNFESKNKNLNFFQSIEVSNLIRLERDLNFHLKFI